MGLGIRVDGGTAYSGAVATRFYDPLLEKVTAWAQTPEEAIKRMDRALFDFRKRKDRTTKLLGWVADVTVNGIVQGTFMFSRNAR
ncbi:hypothetical protein [Fluviibacter phosphoraccumulans]|uniref:hypothetical protein n=1 Tax=Fluviibacter phosphoraccumulans TaxID=1751046 RepID=UPI0024E1ED16|nr:hypothetical protein [Fluviibacter phosphoraccumulans]